MSCIDTSIVSHLNKKYLISPCGIVLCALTVNVNAASLDSPAAATDANSAMYTVDDIYYRLNTGAAGSKRTTTFTEPSSGPNADTAHNLNDVMGKAPVLDNTHGASASEVLTGKTYWGLKNGEWGPQTGTMTNQGSTDITPDFSSGNHTIPAGYYNGSGAVLKDSNLVTGNIKSGVTISGVSGKTEVVDIPDKLQNAWCW